MTGVPVDVHVVAALAGRVAAYIDGRHTGFTPGDGPTAAGR
ncbi:MAG: hypothetical protein V5A62_11910 [Haloarculaceae archaeon]